MDFSKAKNVIRWLLGLGFEYDHTTGGHSLYAYNDGNGHKGKIVVSTHSELSPAMRHVIQKEAQFITGKKVIMMLIIVGVLGYWLWNDCPDSLYNIYLMFV